MPIVCRQGPLVPWPSGPGPHASHDALTLGQEVAHPFSHTYALTSAAALHQFRRERHRPKRRQRSPHASQRSRGCRTGEPGERFCGLGLGRAGTGSGGHCADTPGLGCHEPRGQSCYPVFSCPAGRGVWEHRTGRGRAERAGGGAANSSPKGVRFYEAELHRLRGELLLQHAVAQPGEAEAGFQQALTVARHQQAKSLERAATSLAHLSLHQGKRAEAYAPVARVYGWFTEGLTPPISRRPRHC